ncbi:MAG: hypothetical protein IJB94_03260 [Clostridia bacterium]|nr:hypothetical protein [Clostridia bacterium]
MPKHTVAVLGGDKRMDFAARELTRLGYDVREWGRREGDSAAGFARVADEWLSAVDVLMLPLPTSTDGAYLQLIRTGCISKKYGNDNTFSIE